MDPSISVRLDPRLVARLAEKKARLDILRPLPPAVVQRLADDMRVLLTYHSNAIEGNTLSLYETKMVIEEGVTISGQPLRYYLEARNMPRRSIRCAHWPTARRRSPPRQCCCSTA